jgi:hypothetical protein
VRTALKLTPVQPVAKQRDFFSPATETPVYPVGAVARGDALRGARYDRALTQAQAATLLGITVAELAGAELGAFAFDEAEALRLLRKARP